MSQPKRPTKKRTKRPDEAPTPEPSPSPPSLAALVSLAGLSALWALFQWTELLVARAGGESFCGFSQSNRCAEVWDSPAASAVQAWTGLPVAAWGLVWSLVAFALPLWTLVRRSRGLSIDRCWSATLITGLAGGVVVLTLLTITLLDGEICETCAVSYLLTGTYMAIGFLQTPPRQVSLRQGAPHALGAAGLAFALLLYPGLRTPQSSVERNRALLDLIAPQEGEHASAGNRGAAQAQPRFSAPSHREGPEERRRRDEKIAEVVENLSPQLKQEFADALADYAASPQLPMRPPRALFGAADAPVRITEFIDSLCGHCAAMHGLISEFTRMLPPGAFSIESRHFPLDSSCNPAMTGDSRAPVRCFAAKAQICMEGEPHAFAFTAHIFDNQDRLDRERVLRLAEPLVPREQLEACIASPETEARLADDIAWALEHDIVGTPMILLNGRKTTALGPLIYALVLNRGETTSPAFDALPEPTPSWSKPWR